MIVRDGITLGQLTADIFAEATWPDDGFVGEQALADHVEGLFQFAASHGVWNIYRPEMLRRASQRDGAIAELRAASILNFRGFMPTTWRPTGQGTKQGEFIVTCPSRDAVFVEVKGPGWEGELHSSEYPAGRAKAAKYVRGDGRVIRNGEVVARTVDKAYPKFQPTVPNLLIIADDLFLPLQVGAEIWAREALYSTEHSGKFADDRCANLGGVAFLSADVLGQRLHLDLLLFVNPRALIQLPEQLISAFHGRSM